MTVTIDLPIKTVNPLNGQWTHWRKRRKLVNAEKETTTMIVKPRLEKGRIPCSVVLTRKHWAKPMDSDAVPPSLKAIRDAIAKCIGIDDGDARIQWSYQQAKCKHKDFGVIVEIRYVGEPTEGG